MTQPINNDPATPARKAETAPVPLRQRLADWLSRAWRPAGTIAAVCLAALLMWHVANGKNGLNAWHKKRAEDLQLRKEIDDLQSENTRLRERIERLKSDPGAIEHEARQKLHYAKPDEVIVDLPPDPKQQPAPPAGAAK